jgi:putative flavoprotein involved in K+ transport
MGHALAKTLDGHRFVILDAHPRVGDAWRTRWDSLRLFTPARYCSLPGMRFPASGGHMLTKDEMADYLESYARRFALPVRTGVHVDGLRRDGSTYIVSAGPRRFEAANVIVATGAHREGRIPTLARDLDPSTVQLHSSQYRNPSQLQPGGVLVAGAGNSGGDIALELSNTHPVWLAGPDRGHVPIDIDTPFARLVATRIIVFLGRHLVTLRTPIGRRVRAAHLTNGDPLPSGASQPMTSRTA